MKEIDPGHRYELLTLDGDMVQALQFVKREGSGYPGNVGHNPGTSLQSVLRACYERVVYLNKQKQCLENEWCLKYIEESLWYLEVRAARQHGRDYPYSAEYARTAPMCNHCGHTFCEEGMKDGKLET